MKLFGHSHLFKEIQILTLPLTMAHSVLYQKRTWQVGSIMSWWLKCLLYKCKDPRKAKHMTDRKLDSV